MRTVNVTYDGDTDTVPEIWLVGRSATRQREGLDPRDAYHQAVADWFEQKWLAEQQQIAPVK